MLWNLPTKIYFCNLRKNQYFCILKFSIMLSQELLKNLIQQRKNQTVEFKASIPFKGWKLSEELCGFAHTWQIKFRTTLYYKKHIRLVSSMEFVERRGSKKLADIS